MMGDGSRFVRNMTAWLARLSTADLLLLHGVAVEDQLHNANRRERDLTQASLRLYGAAISNRVMKKEPS